MQQDIFDKAVDDTIGLECLKQLKFVGVAVDVIDDHEIPRPLSPRWVSVLVYYGLIAEAGGISTT